MTTILREAFEGLGRWIGATGVSSIVAGRNGNCVSIPAGTNDIQYRIDPSVESATVTLGFAFQVSSIATARTFLVLRSDTNTTNHLTFQVLTDGSIQVRRGLASGTILGTTATALVAINTWYYFEVQAVLSDTVGVVTINLNGTQRLALTAQDTKNVGTKTTFDTVALNCLAGGVHLFDDLYLKVGAGETFNGSTAVTNTMNVLDARQSARVALQGAAAALDIIRDARHSVRVAIGPVTTPMVKAWSGSAFVDAPVRVWNGSAFVDAVAVKTWNGSAFV